MLQEKIGFLDYLLIDQFCTKNIQKHKLPELMIPCQHLTLQVIEMEAFVVPKKSQVVTIGELLEAPGMEHMLHQQIGVKQCCEWLLSKPMLYKNNNTHLLSDMPR